MHKKGTYIDGHKRYMTDMSANQNKNVKDIIKKQNMISELKIAIDKSNLPKIKKFMLKIKYQN